MKDLNEVAERLARGESLHRISEAMELQLDTVKRYRDEAIRQWRELVKEGIDSYLGREIAVLNRVAAEAWTAWETSKLPKVRRKVRLDKEPVADGIDKVVGRSTELIKEETPGDPRFLDVVLSCSDKRLRLLGYKRGEPGQAAPDSPQEAQQPQPAVEGEQPAEEVRAVGLAIAAVLFERGKAAGVLGNLMPPGEH